MITHHCHARVGLLGNPSDGYSGKTLSFILRDLFAQVSISPDRQFRIEPHPIHDSLQAASIGSLIENHAEQDFGGGVRLLQAICRRFWRHCREKGIELSGDCGMCLRYDTNIPRSSGLAGSSAIVCAALNCLMDFFKVRHRIPLDERPGMILGAEEDLGIVAGLQDRVAQVYGGLVYMDFEKSHMEQHGHGRYEAMDPGLLPSLLVVLTSNPSNSGKVHSNVRQRWLDGDPAVHEGMASIAELAEQGRAALETKQHHTLAALMNKNFQLRCQIFGKARIGKGDHRAVEIAQSFGGAAKLCGSGGAVLVMLQDGHAQDKPFRGACKVAGFDIYDAIPGDPCPNLGLV